jgi:vacuolar-type H+-ATPase subunit H
MDTVLQLLDALEDILDQSNSVPFTSKIMINKEEFYEIITEIRLKLPNEIKQSKWVIEERNKILIDAQKEADNLMKDAENRLNKLVDGNEITKKAYEQAEEIIESAKQTSKEMRLGAMEYADEILSHVEKGIKTTMDSIHDQCTSTEDYLTQTINVIYQNRQELRGNKK